MTAEQIEKAIEKIRPEHGDINGWIVVEYKDLEIIRNTIGKLVDENEKLKEELKNRPIVDFTYDVHKDLEDYKSRCEKAIEYINNNKLYDFEYDEEEIFEIVSDKIAKEYLLNILNGSDENDS